MKSEVRFLRVASIRLAISVVLFFQLNHTSAQGSTENVDLSAPWLNAELYSAEEMDASMVQLSTVKKKWDLNRINSQELWALGFFTEQQVDDFFTYKKLMGDFKDPLELQAIPGWNIELVRKVVSNFKVEFIPTTERFKEGLLIDQSIFLFRLRGLQNKNLTPKEWIGSGEGLQVIYQYKSPVIQTGVTLEKDPGEKLFNKRLRTGVDFLSAYMALQCKGLIRTIFIGDYTVNFGQGLIQWQSFGLRKTPLIGLLKKTGPSIRPYRSVGEYNFHRGMAVSGGKKNQAFDFFISSRMLSVNLGLSAVNNELGVTSFNTNGYHRTSDELQKRNNFHQWTTGFRYTIRLKNFRGGFNSVAYLFSKPLIVSSKPYDLYSINSNKWLNSSVDFSFFWRGWHFFSEQAFDLKGSYAGLIGGLVSFSKHVEIGMIGRVLSAKYQSLYSNAFTESSRPGNENGFFLVANARLTPGLQLHFFVDTYQFPWLRYTINRPSRGRECLLQFVYEPSKTAHYSIVFRSEIKDQNMAASNAPGPLKLVSVFKKAVWRAQWQQDISSLSTLTFRTEALTASTPGKRSAQGFLSFFDWRLKWAKTGFFSHIRCLYFDTDSYESTVYAFTPQIGSHFQLSQFTGKGENIVLFIENEIVRWFTGRIGVNYENKRGDPASKINFSLQIVMKLHYLGQPKNYRTI